VTTVVADLSDVPDHYFEQRLNRHGEMYYHLDTLVHISMQSTLEFYLTVGGKKYGSVTAQYD
jgi:hypothetical protein